jgi:hypothetical protein
MLQIHQSENHDFKWISVVMSIFDNTGLSYVFSNQLNINIHLLKPALKERLHDHFIQQWFTDIENASRGEFYSIFKIEFGFEKYLSKLSVKNKINLSKFRCSNMKFPIQTGGWQNIARNDRMCTFCRENIGDEFHYLFICKHELMAALRSTFIPKYYTSKGLLSLCNVPLFKNISLFIIKLFSKLCFSCSHRNRFVINRQCTYIYCIIEFLYFVIVIPC